MQKELPQVSFLVFTEQLLCYINFGRLHCYEVTLVKKYNKPLIQKSETKIFNRKRFIKNSFKVNEKSKSGVLRIIQMSNLLKLIWLNCYQIQQLLALLHYILNTSIIFTFHILLTILHSIYICTEDDFAIKWKILLISTISYLLPEYWVHNKMNLFGLSFVLFTLKWSSGKGFDTN